MTQDKIIRIKERDDMALQSLIKETSRLIQSKEGRYAKSVLSDFTDAIKSSDNPHKTAYKWLQKYRGKKPRIQPQKKNKTVSYRRPATNLSKFAQMWECTNEICFHFNHPVNSDKLETHLARKKQALLAIQKLVDADTKEHFRTTLTEVLRSERYQQIRKEAIWMLAKYFSWNEIEYTFDLHHTRQPRDSYILIAAMNWCQSKHKDEKSLHAAVMNSTRQLLKETIGG